MTLSDLNPHELRVFMGLFKLVVHADRTVSPEERAMMEELSQSIGVPQWNEAVAAAREAYATVEELEDDAKQLTRQAAREHIHAVLSELAHSDELVEGEAHVLQWMIQEWGVDAIEHDDHDTFDLIAED